MGPRLQLRREKRHGKVDRRFLPRHPDHRSALDQDCGRDHWGRSSADLLDRGLNQAQRVSSKSARKHNARLSPARSSQETRRQTLCFEETGRFANWCLIFHVRFGSLADISLRPAQGHHPRKRRTRPAAKLVLTSNVLDGFPFLECSFDCNKILMLGIFGMLFDCRTGPSKPSAPIGANRVFRKNLG